MQVLQQLPGVISSLDAYVENGLHRLYLVWHTGGGGAHFILFFLDLDY